MKFYLYADEIFVYVCNIKSYVLQTEDYVQPSQCCF